MEDPEEQYDGLLAGYVERGRTERIYVGVREFKGSRFIDMRIFYESDEEWRPTQKGFTLPVDAFPEFAEAVGALGLALGFNE